VTDAISDFMHRSREHAAAPKRKGYLRGSAFVTGTFLDEHRFCADGACVCREDAQNEARQADARRG
jgi:hypothetical protein